MEDDPRYGARARRHVTPFVQGGLALLVAGTLVTFSFLALRTGFAEQPRGGVAAVDPDRANRGPVVLPSTGDDVRRTDEAAEVALQGSEGSTGATNAESERVLGNRVTATDDGTPKRGSNEDADDVRSLRQTEAAREEEDPDGDDHGADDQDDSEGSRSGTRGDRTKHGSRGHSRGSHGRSRGTRDHSRGASHDRSAGSRGTNG